MSASGYTVKLTVRRADNGEVVLSTMLGDALAAIDERGAIYSAARAIGASYSHVWGDLRRAEGVHGGPLVESSGARGSELTCRGRDVLERFRRLSGAIERELASWPPLAPPTEGAE